jgi:site-specific DNA-methyltransferase (adenine-specific)
MPMRRNGAQDAVNAGASRQGGRQRAGVDYQRRMARDSRDFQSWCETWAVEALRVLKPGGHMLAFGGTRTYHRLTCAIEDAGFEIRDCLSWLYGSGFPKSLDVSKAIDKAAGAEREVVGPGRYAGRESATDLGVMNDDAWEGGAPRTLTAPATAEAAEWEGWGTALKPAWEPIVVARKPLAGTVAANVLQHGTGNVVLDEEAAARLDGEVGELTSGANPTRRDSDKFRTAYGDFEGQRECHAPRGTDTGGPSRFFYTAKASSAERDGATHPTVKPLALMRWCVRLVTPPGGVVLDPFAGSGTTLLAARDEGFRAVGIEREPEYAAMAAERYRRRFDPGAAEWSTTTPEAGGQVSLFGDAA